MMKILSECYICQVPSSDYFSLASSASQNYYENIEYETFVITGSQTGTNVAITSDNGVRKISIRAITDAGTHVL